MQETLSERLFRLRNENNLTQEQAAEAVGISRVALTRYENGQRMPKMNIVDSLAKIYGVSIDYLMGREETTEQSLSAPDPTTSEGLELLSRLNEDQLDRAIEYMRFLLSQKK